MAFYKVRAAMDGFALNLPLVSVVIPMYNASGTIGRTLFSACSQTYPRLEIIVVDDGSVDDGADIVLQHSANDSRIRLIHQANAGVAAARNAGIAKSTGDFIAPLDADDLWHPEKTERQMAAMCDEEGRDDPQIGLVYCWFSIIDADDHIRLDDCRSKAKGNVLRAIAGRNIIGHGSGALIRRNAFLETGGYDASLLKRGGEGCEDYKLYFQIAERHSFALVPEFLVGYRETRENMSSDPRRALRSRDLCVPEMISRHPELSSEFHAGCLRLMRFMLGRAVRNCRARDAFFLLGEMLKRDPLLAILHFGALASGLAKRVFRLRRRTTFVPSRFPDVPRDG